MILEVSSDGGARTAPLERRSVKKGGLGIEDERPALAVAACLVRLAGGPVNRSAGRA
jgi:hypothetical protein